MDLLAGYGSDESASDTEQPKCATQGAERDSKHRNPEKESSAPSSKKRVIDYSRLPVSRPLVLDDSPVDSQEPPLKKSAMLENKRLDLGRSLLDSLPPPKVTLGSDTIAGSSSRIDLSDLRPQARTHKISVLQSEDAHAQIQEDTVVPEGVMHHPMFSDGSIGTSDGPSFDEVAQMREVRSFKSIKADDMKDPDWYIHNQMTGGPGLHKGKTVPIEMSMYDAPKWQTNTLSNASRVQKRKHQINWLAQEAMDKEAELLDRNATSKLTKAQTQMKYGW